MTKYLESKFNLEIPGFAETFDDLTYWSSMFGQLLFRHLPIRSQVSILDVGCATGFPLLELANRFGPESSIQGIDSWKQALNHAAHKIKMRGDSNVQLTHGSAAKMPFEDQSFDLVVSNLGVNNFDEPEKVMSECRRVLRLGGSLTLTSNLFGHMDEFYRIFQNVLEQSGHPDLVQSLRKQEAQRATIESLQKLFEANGFRVSAVHQENFSMRFANGSAFLGSYFCRVSFLEGWRGIIGRRAPEVAIFEQLEKNLNELSADKGFCVSIPAVYIEGLAIS